MKKNLKTALIILGLIFISISILPNINPANKVLNYLNYLVWGNDLDVSCSDSLDETKLKIIFENEVAIVQNFNPQEATRLMKNPGYRLIRTIIYENGKQINDVPYDYGKQRLIIAYDDKTIGELGHWRTNAYHVHTYKVTLQLKENKVILVGSISGPDQMINYSKNY